MFTSLHALAKQATLMITIAAEGDDELRVNVTPVPADTKSKAKLPQPLSLRATPAEFDADFIAALATWQAPKRTLLQQAQDATGGAQAPAASDAAKPADKPTEKPQEKTKPGRKPRGDKPAGSAPAATMDWDDDAGAAGAGPAAGADAAAGTADAGGADAAPGAADAGAAADAAAGPADADATGGAVHLVTAGAAANVTEISARQVLLDEVDGAGAAPLKMIAPADDPVVDTFTLDLF